MQTRVDEQSPQTFQARLYVGQVALVSGVVVGSVWFATQWTAAELGYQAALGSVWHHLGPLPIYKPWRLFQWWYAYAPYAPHIFNRGGQIAAGGGVLGVVVAMASSVWRSRHVKFATTYGSARWASAKDLVREDSSLVIRKSARHGSGNPGAAYRILPFCWMTCHSRSRSTPHCSKTMGALL